MSSKAIVLCVVFPSFALFVSSHKASGKNVCLLDGQENQWTGEEMGIPANIPTAKWNATATLWAACEQDQKQHPTPTPKSTPGVSIL